MARRVLRWRTLKPIVVLPAVFLLGFGGYFAFGWTQQKIREARFAAPSDACLNGLHPARLGDVDLDIPVAPGLFLWGIDRDNEHYILWSNPHARTFCALAERDPVALSGVHFKIDGSPSRRVAETKMPFCSRKHAEYPWADMACNLIASRVIPDNPVRVDVDLSKGRFDWVAKEREAMQRNPVSIAPDGVIRQRADLDSLAFPKRGESESLGQTGVLRCDRGFRYVKILMEKVSGVCRGSRRMPPRYDACWRSH